MWHDIYQNHPQVWQQDFKGPPFIQLKKVGKSFYPIKALFSSPLASVRFMAKLSMCKLVISLNEVAANVLTQLL